MNQRIFAAAAAAVVLSFVAVPALAECEEGEIKIRFSHVTNSDKHPKGIAASLLEKRVNEEMKGKDGPEDQDFNVGLKLHILCHSSL